MPILFIKYVLPVILFIGVQIYLSSKDSRFLGLIIPAISICLTVIFSSNALETVGFVFALTIMLIPNVLSIGLYIITKKIKKYKDDEIIRLKFKK